jgi:hypothetical protein
MASELDTVKALRALFNDMPRAPQGLSHADTMAWIQRSMTDFEGGEVAYALEHITRSSMLDIVLRFREDGHLQDDAAFDATLQQLSTPEGRKAFMDQCIQAQKSVDMADRLIKRAKRPMSDPGPLFGFDADHIRRFVADQPTGPGPLWAEFSAREDVRHVGVCEPEPEAVHEFDWGFVTEDHGSWHVYVADVWRKGTVGYFHRFMSAWQLELSTQPDGGMVSPPPLPPGLTLDDGIGRFCALTLDGGPHLRDPAVRRWMGETFLARILPYMAGRAVDDDYDFPA